jgi:hypothetical protein
MKSIIAIAALFVVAHAQTPARAELVTFAFAGEATGVYDPVGLLDAAGISVGTPFAGFYTFESATPPDAPSSGSYPDAITAVSGVVGGEAFFGVAGPNNHILVFDNFPAGLDQYLLSAPVSFLDYTAGMAFHLRDPDAGLFSSQALPVVPPSLEGLSLNFFGVASLDNNFVVTGSLTSLSLVPEPATLVLLAGGWSFWPAVVSRS